MLEAAGVVVNYLSKVENVVFGKPKLAAAVSKLSNIVKSRALKSLDA